ncbi:MAG: glycoside hydrolase family 57 protein [Methylohalobius sp. ZOD2]
MAEGYLAFVLHAHLPYVRHPEYDNFLEERWLFEAITETYLPLIRMLDRLASERVSVKLTLSVSPSLLAMLEDPLLQQRYAAHLTKLLELSEKELERNRHDPHFHYLAGTYQRLFIQAREVFLDQYEGRLSSAFKNLHEQGVIDLITTTATHGLLPLLASRPKSVEAQVRTGLDYFERVFGFRPSGMWLPECGYYPGLDELLSREGIRFFVMESHGLEHAETTPFYGVHAPLYSPSGVAAFGRDQGSTKQVWSAREGFPGHPDYREFYRDIGHDLDFDYIRPYIAGDVRVDTGIKYFRITGPTAWKEPYHPEMAKERAAQHAGEFLYQRISHIEYLDSIMETAPIVVAPFDAELFGHWWFEGPQWLEFVLRKGAFDQDTLELGALSDYLDRHPVHQVGTLCTSTWGHKGYFEGWMNGKTDWIYPQLYECGQRMERLAKRYVNHSVPSLIRRALNQCVRELLLAQSSDWPFIINNETAADYAERRVKDHVARFHYLAESLEQETIDEEYLAALESMDNLFPQADYRLFQ